MSRTFVLDTSVAIAWYLPETFSTEAREWQKNLLKNTVALLVPRHLHYLEFSNVLRTHVRRGEIDRDLAREIYALHLEAPLREIDIAMADVLETALEFESTTYDATYISLSLTQGAPIVTAERSTTPWVVKLADSVITMKK
jgi:predicted nucleic acid-binding protein